MVLAKTGIILAILARGSGLEGLLNLFNQASQSPYEFGRRFLKG
jgi:hypothetical protein